jgi:thiol-disulfide isomerase/thioredoxin
MFKLPLLTYIFSAFLLFTASRATGQTHDENVVAQVDGHVIYATDVDNWWKVHDPVSFFQNRDTVYLSRKRALDALVSDYLLALAAENVGLTEEELLSEEVSKKVEPVLDVEVLKMYEQLRSSGSDLPFEQARPSLFRSLQHSKLRIAEAKYLEELWHGFGSKARLSFERPRHTFDARAADSRTLGTPSANIHVIEFADFLCPYCRQVEPVIKEIIAKYGDRIEFEWRDYPLPNHPGANSMAEAAMCASEQQAFWRFHDILLMSQQPSMSEKLQQHAEDAGLDVAVFKQCVDAGRFRQHILDDTAEGRRHGINATPAIFINGRPVIGAGTFALYDKIIREELERDTSWHIGP